MNVNEFTIKLRAMSDEDLIKRFNRDVGIPGWIAARGRFQQAMREEFMRREFNYSAIGDELSISFKHKIVLKDKTVRIKSN